MSLCLNSKLNFDKVYGIGFEEDINSLLYVLSCLSQREFEKTERIFALSYGVEDHKAVQESDRTSITTSALSDVGARQYIRSSEGEIILYLYFLDSVDLESIQIVSDKKMYFAVYPFLVDVDFGNLSEYKPEAYGVVTDDNQASIQIQNIYYFTMLLKSEDNSPLSVKSIELYGKRNRLNTLRLNHVALKWSPGECVPLSRRIAGKNMASEHV